MIGSGNKHFEVYTPEDNSTREIAFLETILNQRISFFLLFFCLVVAGAVFIKSKIFFLLILFLGFVISWVLSLTIFVTVSKLTKIDKNIFARIVRWLIGYFLPFFCSLLITAAFAVGSFGIFDSYLSLDVGKVPAVKEGIKKIEKALTPKDTASRKNNPNFKDVERVIKEGAESEAADLNLKQGASAVPQQKNTPKAKPNPNFKSIESLLNEKKKR